MHPGILEAPVAEERSYFNVYSTQWKEETDADKKSKV